MSRVIVITGASKGIGLGFVRHYLKDKNNAVIGGARSKVADFPEGAELLPLDVTDNSSVTAFAEDVAKRHKKVDLLINNAGVATKSGFDEVDAEEFLKVYKVNVIGVMQVIQSFVRSNLLTDGSLVANISSGVGSIGNNTSGGYYAYRASKAALNMVIKSMTRDLADRGITFTLLHPGYVATDMTSHKGTLSVEQSVKTMTEILHEKSHEELNGNFFGTQKQPLPW
mmetsp:Transcript_7548/g.22904  ORF Transcript_7548/g.22904 Transcript_7548/m.22904 type:complete len:226 (+) Transcript_7548:148-825(+)|eukprot:CAMPEP_0198725562 /NCGR_PEP_ID=MMETSP1475-20131203/2850_1 /TAXON_ID= ORGANISM="Unidentified sp., Strain CCMP1999" /NCGR_SAMPLE_ID=MMETSP1475 /ASSEMBLY_ACC=CAM_ASM_001111 /LENGTH=225 /DNA_ID=CAMNT_0044487361 /DNA_START=67 /DNA_END=744 /DNA_ORIENTATION=-